MLISSEFSGVLFGDNKETIIKRLERHTQDPVPS